MNNLFPWFSLKSVPGIGNILFKRLIDRFHFPEAVFESPDNELLKVKGVTPRLISALRRQQVPDWVKRDMEIADRNGYRIITQSDRDYPLLLHQIPDPPPILYVYGQLRPKALHIAIVGSRNATQYGLTAAHRLGKDLGSKNIVIVSGMARGIDTAAHKGALAANSRTIAVLGSGLEKIYPPENKKLFHQIAQQGAVISEFSLFADPEPHHFPIRNRIISGISHGTVIVEAGGKSGSLITARLAAEQNKEVFAVPGNINSFRSTGTHALIKQGAKLVENADDILEEFNLQIDVEGDTEANSYDCKKKMVELSKEEQHLLKNLEPYPIHVDELIRKIGIDAGKIAGLLMQLEIKGLVTQTQGKYFCLVRDMNSRFQ
jgi:DNA processing protein